MKWVSRCRKSDCGLSPACLNQSLLTLCHSSTSLALLGKTGDISYYDIDSDSWSYVGDLEKDVNTPVCDIAYLDDGDWLMCVSPGGLSKRRKISI